MISVRNSSFLFVFFFAGAFAGGNPERVVTIPLSHAPATVDPISQNVLQMVREGLTRIGPEGEVEMAQSDYYRVSSDYKTYTFYLRDSHWSDGTDVTADHFVSAWEDTYPIAVVKAEDPKTLKIELTEPCPNFLELLATPTFFPIPKFSNSLLLSNGPFVLQSSSAERLSFIANPSYWDCNEVKLDVVILEIVGREQPLSSFSQEKVDLK